MSDYDDRLETLRKLAQSAQKQMLDLPVEAWPGEGTRDHCLGVLSYVLVVLQASDANLLSDQAFSSINSALASFETDPPTAANSADPYTSSLIDAINLLPAARDRDIEQAVKDAAANFQRSAQHRLNALRADFDETNGEIEALRQSTAERSQELATAIDERKTQVETEIGALQASFAAKLGEFETELGSERTALSTLRNTQTASFEEAEDQRNTIAKERLAAADADLKELRERAAQEVEARVAEIRRMEEESAQLVGAIGLAGTAERYGQEVAEQKRVADIWRRVTVLVALGAVGAAVFALAEKHPATETFTGKLALSLILGGIATYAARQSANHRHREQRARDLQLELTAFAPFIEPLSPEQQEEERVIMTRKTFGKTTSAERQAEEPGPTALSLMLRRKEKEAGEAA